MIHQAPNLDVVVSDNQITVANEMIGKLGFIGDEIKDLPVNFVW